MNAYDYLESLPADKLLTEQEFNDLIVEFQRQYLENEGYEEAIAKHRNPVEVKSALIRKISDYDLSIQRRPEMHYHDTVAKTVRAVPTMVIDAWMADKTVRSLYNAVAIVCRNTGLDFKTTIVHIAEYRAMNKLGARIRRASKFTFQHWVDNAFYSAASVNCSYVANDSEKYLDMVMTGKMTYDTLNQIQAAQQQAYDYMIEYSLLLNVRQLQRQTQQTLDMQQVIDGKTTEVQQYIAANVKLYQDVLLPKLHRQIKIGAKFLLPEHYQCALERGVLDLYTLPRSKYLLTVDGKLQSFPLPEQLESAIMELQIRWLRYLQNYRAKLRFEAMVTSKDFKTLIDNYGEAGKLEEDYMKGLNFAPDRQLFIRNRIANYESSLPRYQSSMAVWDRQHKNEIPVHTGEYRRIGYAWVNNGYNAGPMDFRTSTLGNISIPSDIPQESRYDIYVQQLFQLASGGAIAFHLAYLREQLKTKSVPKTKKQPVDAIWIAAPEQRLQLFYELTAASFMEATDENAGNFMNNRVVQWKQDARSLYYLLEQLSMQKYHAVERFAPLSTILKNNFVNKNAEHFTNTRQNKSGMINGNKTNKPRHAAILDDILDNVFAS